MRYVVRQFPSQVAEDAFCGTPEWIAIRMIQLIALNESLKVMTGNFTTAFMNTPLDPDDAIYIERHEELGGGGEWAWKLKRSLNGLVLCGSDFRKTLVEYS